jgi:hypothetical protein
MFVRRIGCSIFRYFGGVQRNGVLAYEVVVGSIALVSRTHIGFVDRNKVYGKKDDGRRRLIDRNKT